MRYTGPMPGASGGGLTEEQTAQLAQYTELVRQVDTFTIQRRVTRIIGFVEPDIEPAVELAS